MDVNIFGKGEEPIPRYKLRLCTNKKVMIYDTMWYGLIIRCVHVGV